jgi:hypothetical protein
MISPFIYVSGQRRRGWRVNVHSPVADGQLPGGQDHAEPGAWAASPEDLERKPWRAAAAHQPGDLAPVDVAGHGLGQRLRDLQPDELCHPPFMHEQVVLVDRLMAWSCGRRFHR